MELREAEALIARKLRANPESAAWLQARARADLLESDYPAAIQDLRRAQDSAPADPGILGDLAIAYIQAGAPEDLPRALEAFGQAIMAQPNDPVLRFNRATTYHRLHMLKSAVDEWKVFLSIEKTGAWADEARARLADDEDLIRRQADAARGTRAGVPEESAEPGEAPVFDALARWVPADGSATTAPRTQELVNLAHKFVARYDDWWLKDFLDALDRRPDQRDVASLELAQDAGRRGDPAAERMHAEESLRGFALSGNKPGAVRAKYELLYSFQRSSKPADCLRMAKTLSNDLAGERYPSLQGQAWVEQAGCARMTGDFASAEPASAGHRDERGGARGPRQVAGCLERGSGRPR